MNPHNPSNQNTSGESQNSSGDSWMNNPRLSGIDMSKLEMLQNLANQGSQKSQSDLMPFLMAAANQGKANGLSFQPNEIDTIIEVLKMGKSPQEAAKLDKIVNLMRMMKK